jgi:hypothetical protein
MLAQMQVTTAIPSLTVLLEHPEFRQGLAIAQEYFLDEHEEAPSTPDEMIEEVELELSRRVIEADKKIRRLFKDQLRSYFYHLGFVFGTIRERGKPS